MSKETIREETDRILDEAAKEVARWPKWIRDSDIVLRKPQRRPEISV